MPRPLLTVAAVVWSVGIAVSTLAPLPWRPQLYQSPGGVLDPGTWLDRSTWASGSPLEFLANVLLFAPWAVILVRRGSHAVATIAAGALFSFAIEMVQLALPDRASDPRDLVANTIGAAIGALIGSAANAVSRARRRARDARTARVPARSW